MTVRLFAVVTARQLDGCKANRFPRYLGYTVGIGPWGGGEVCLLARSASTLWVVPTQCLSTALSAWRCEGVVSSTRAKAGSRAYAIGFGATKSACRSASAW